MAIYAEPGRGGGDNVHNNRGVIQQSTWGIDEEGYGLRAVAMKDDSTTLLIMIITIIK